VREGAGHCADDLEAQLPVEPNSTDIGRRHGIELHPGEALLARPIQGEAAERLADAPSARIAGDHEAGSRDMRAGTGPVLSQLGAAENALVLKRDHRQSRR
jgi:hypothetical protein